MRIGIDISVTSYNNAGNARYTRCLFQALQQQAATYNLHIVPFNLPPSFNVVTSGFRRKAVVLFWEFIYAPRLLGLFCRIYRCDLLHTTAPTPIVYVPCPVVTTILDMTPILYPQWFTPTMGMRLRRWTKRSLQKAAAIITISKHTAEDVRRLMPTLHVPIQAIHLGSFLEADSGHALSAPLPQVGNQPYVLTVGTLEPRKNLKLVLEAYHLLDRQGVKLPHLVVVGARGWMVQNIEAEVQRLGLVGQVTLVGFVSDAQLRSLYVHATMLVYPSLYEGFGFPVLEAMSCGCPVITSDTSSLPEVIGDVGIMINPYNPQQLAQAIHLVLQHPAYAAHMRRKGILRAQGFSWRRCAEETAEVYRFVLKETI